MSFSPRSSETQETMELSPCSSSESETTSKSSAADSLPQLEVRDRYQMFSILQTITSNLLQDESFSTLPGLSHSFSSLPSAAFTPSGNPEDEVDDEDVQLARDLHSLVLHSSQREPQELQNESSSSGEILTRRQKAGPIVLPADFSSLDEILDTYCNAAVFNGTNSGTDLDDDDDSSSGGTVDSLLVYKARRLRRSAAASD